MVPVRMSRPLRVALFVGLGLALLALVLPAVLTPWIADRVHAAARARGLEAEWRRLAFRWPLHVEIDALAVKRDTTTVLRADRVRLDACPRGFTPHLSVTRLELEDAHLLLPESASDDERDDPSTDPEEESPTGAPAAPRVRAAAQQLADALLLPARRLPTLYLNDVRVQRGDSLFARLDGLSLTHERDGVQFAATGALAGEQVMPFDVMLQWHHDDRLMGRIAFDVPEANGDRTSLPFLLDGRVTQDRHAGVLRIADDSRVTVGPVVLHVGGEVRRRGPRFACTLAVDSLTAANVQRHLPRAVLGPLADVPVAGRWDWRASLVVDVSAPDSTRFTADVIPHGLALAGSDAQLRLNRLAGPFVAEIHVPRGLVRRDLSDANPHYRPLARISPLLQHALLTNEDGSFYQHRGFNTGAIQSAMAANLRSGTFKRGAGTITMQLARNLFLGHRRTLSRKGQEVVLAWMLEHMTGLGKDRLLEIYLNIIEWGPGVHGADEAARFYFDKDATDLTLDEALFLTVIVPSPSRWRSRVNPDGTLRPWARAQMAYIARKMVSREWLAPEQVPTAEGLSITLRGEAARAFAPVDSTLTTDTVR
ncbi:MAG: hypothetical protein RL760_1284 [Candidatus Eisenbacteria bacterium]